MSEVQIRPNSDLKTRTLSAVVMIAVAGAALWIGGSIWAAFTGLIALVVFWEWNRLVLAFEQRLLRRLLWVVGGSAYIGGASLLLGFAGSQPDGLYAVAVVLLAVIFTDIGAYASGRTFGGPKIAPSISPSKTWAGLGGGMAAAASLGVVVTYFQHRTEVAEFTEYVRQFGTPDDWYFEGWRWDLGIMVGCFAAIVAQAGDFFQSWMKRRAGVKDSSNLIPGHGGVFDRVDGLIAVLFVIAVVQFAKVGSTL